MSKNGSEKPIKTLNQDQNKSDNHSQSADMSPEFSETMQTPAFQPNQESQIRHSQKQVLERDASNAEQDIDLAEKSDTVSFQLTKTSLWGISGLILFSGFLYLFSPILMPFVVSLIFAYTLHPLVTHFETALKRVGVNHNMGRGLATFILVLCVIAFIVTIVLVAFPFLRDELKQLSQTLPTTISYLSETYLPTIKAFVSKFSTSMSGKLETTLTEHASKIVNWVFKALAGLVTNTIAFANIVSLVVLSPFLIFYLLRDWPKMIGYLETLVPPQMKKETNTVFSDINNTISGFFRGQAVVCLLMGIYYTTGLYILGLEYAFIVGFISGTLTFIPYVGFFIGLVAATGLAIAQFGAFQEVLIVIVIYGVGNVLEGFILVPKFVGDKLGLHPLWVIFALLGGGLILGFMGLLLAVPIAGILAVLLRFVMTKYKKHISRD